MQCWLALTNYKTNQINILSTILKCVALMLYSKPIEEFMKKRMETNTHSVHDRIAIRYRVMTEEDGVFSFKFFITFFFFCGQSEIFWSSLRLWILLEDINCVGFAVFLLPRCIILSIIYKYKWILLEGIGAHFTVNISIIKSICSNFLNKNIDKNIGETKRKAEQKTV